MDLFLVMLMSLDSLLACLSCGVRGIRIPRISKIVIAGVGAFCLALSFLLSKVLALLLPPSLFHLVACGALLIIALLCLFDEATRRLSAKLAARCRPLRFRLCGLVLEIYGETAKADQDLSGVLSPAEALVLAVPLSLDSLLTGLSIAVKPFHCVSLIAFSFIFGIFAATLGTYLGKRFRHVAGKYANILGGFALLAVAIFKFFIRAT